MSPISMPVAKVHLIRGLGRELLKLQLVRRGVLGKVVDRPAALQLPPQRRRYTPALTGVLSHNAPENGGAKRGR
eukprot:13420662-Alexandrium_andersonii.AAC.1